MPGGFANAADPGPCPCGAGPYDSCCGPLHRGERRAETAEQLMRSRYSAFATGHMEYLLVTHLQPEVSDGERRRALQRSCRGVRWLGLRILAVNDGGLHDREGTVRFEARFRSGGQIQILQEQSLFQRRNGSLRGDWLYLRAL